MSSRRDRAAKLIEAIEQELDAAPSRSALPAVRKAAQLADALDLLEYRLLFEVHIDGVDPAMADRPRVQRWPSRDRQPRWDFLQAFWADRQLVSTGGILSSPLETIENIHLRCIDLLGERSTGEVIRSIEPTLQDIDRILTRIRVRVSTFLIEAIRASEATSTGAQATERRVFIGHGGSLAWQQLRELLATRLDLPWDEFNRVPTGGQTTVARLSEMLDSAAFAFLVLTGEDLTADGELRARLNVVHELGLFQGKLGFPRAVVLLEEGCGEFSNIHGLSQIRFPRNNILAKSEEIRRVLEREGLLPRGEAS